MNPSPTCPKCSATLPSAAPEGLCPACLMQGGFATDATIKMTPSQKPTSSQPLPTPLPGELAPLFPQLEILELLGRGGMGAVYKARQKNLNRLVALKIITIEDGADPHFAERFQREAQALAKLNHPNIVSVFDFGESDGLFYFLMEFVDGANLRTLICGGELKPEAALALIPTFCDALQYAHDEGVVHRDIKPENVLVDKKGRVKIADFGLAKLLGHEASDHTLTRSGMQLGTPRYMAPEQMDKPETVDHRADIYSLGVVFYEMLTGELPMGRFAPPSQKVQVDVRFDEIVLHALERDVELRYQHVSEIKTDVEGVTSKPQFAPAAKSSASPAADPGDENDEEEVEVTEHPIFAHIWKFFPLGIVVLVFITIFSPWGGKVWPFFGVAVAVLAMASNLFPTIKTKQEDGAKSSDGRTQTAQERASKSATPNGDNSQSLEPRLSSYALWGAIWAAIALLAGAVLLAALSDWQPPRSPYDSYGILGFPVGVWAFFPISALFGVTALGGIAIVRIKRSGGKLTGLRLAVAEVLLFPLPLLAGLLAYASGHALAGTQFNAQHDDLVATLTLGVPLILCFCIGLVIWRAIIPRSETKRIAEAVASEPHLSPHALWGAIWVAVGPFCAAIIYFLCYTYRMGPGMTLVCVAFGLLGVSSIIGGTITSYVAVSRIRTSNGQLTGLPLAAFGVMFYPLLLLGFAAFALTHLIQIAFWTKVHTSYSGDGQGHWSTNAPLPNSYPGMTFMILDSIVTLIVCGFAARVGWRKIAGIEIPATGNNHDAKFQSSEPHLNRLALGGAIWAVLGLLAGIGLLLLYFFYFDTTSTGVLYRPVDWSSMTVFLGLVTVSACFGSMILGGIAIAQIKRSGEKLHGLPLAGFDLLCYPLLLLGFATFALTHLAQLAIRGMIHNSIAPSTTDAPTLMFMILDSIVALIVCFIVGRAAWRAISGDKQSEAAAAAKPIFVFIGSSLHLVLGVVLAVATLWFLLEFGPPVATMIQGPDLALIELGRQWHLGSTVGSIFSKIAAFTVLLGAANFFCWRSYRRACSKM